MQKHLQRWMLNISPLNNNTSEPKMLRISRILHLDDVNVIRVSKIDQRIEK
jgi:hypothetical protein